MAKGFRSILVISDQHFPYNHPDIIAFLRACKKKFKPDKVVNIGDELDFHGISFHSHDPDLLSPSDELSIAIRRLQPVYKMFPEMDLVDSNHGSLVYRQAKANGLPATVLKSYREVIQAPKGWKWHDHIVLMCSDGKPVYFCHGRSGDVLKNSKNVSMRFVQGHHHSKFEIRYWANELDLYWGMTVGCLIERRSLAFAYAKTTGDKQIIGCGVILEGQPRLIPMVLNKHGRWIGKIV